MKDLAFPTIMRTLSFPIIVALSMFVSGCNNAPPVPLRTQGTATPTINTQPIETATLAATPGSAISALTVTVISDLPVPVEALGWSPDSRILATGAGGAAPKEGDDYGVRLWRSDGSLIATLKGHTLG